ncbi:MAG TPA: hypothetical protein VG963_15640 [Polyangiaceae bacterium]|nr:hypothetical protein [Polyangiaceae bacterium]
MQLTDSGTVQVLADGGFKFPTTVAIRGTDAWVPQGQLDHYVGGNPAPPDLPFTVASVPLAGGGVGAAAIDLPGTDLLYPEGIASAADGTLYVGSMKTGKVFKVPAGSMTATQFVADGVLKRGVLGLRVDADRGLLWACDSDPGEMMPGGDIVALKLSDGTEASRHAMSATSLCNDMIVDPGGNVWATDSFGGAIYRVAAADVNGASAAQVWLTDPKITPPMGGFGANGIALVSGKLFISVTASGTTGASMLVSADPASENPASSLKIVALTEAGAPAQLSGPDGILRYGDTELLVVENGFIAPNKQRLIKVTFDTK